MKMMCNVKIALSALFLTSTTARVLIHHGPHNIGLCSDVDQVCKPLLSPIYSDDITRYPSASCNTTNPCLKYGDLCSYPSHLIRNMSLIPSQIVDCSIGKTEADPNHDSNGFLIGNKTSTPRRSSLPLELITSTVEGVRHRYKQWESIEHANDPEHYPLPNEPPRKRGLFTLIEDTYHRLTGDTQVLREEKKQQEKERKAKEKKEKKLKEAKEKQYYLEKHAEEVEHKKNALIRKLRKEQVFQEEKARQKLQAQQELERPQKRGQDQPHSYQLDRDQVRELQKLEFKKGAKETAMDQLRRGDFVIRETLGALVDMWDHRHKAVNYAEKAEKPHNKQEAKQQEEARQKHVEAAMQHLMQQVEHEDPVIKQQLKQDYEEIVHDQQLQRQLTRQRELAAEKQGKRPEEQHDEQDEQQWMPGNPAVKQAMKQQYEEMQQWEQQYGKEHDPHRPKKQQLEQKYNAMLREKEKEKQREQAEKEQEQQRVNKEEQRVNKEEQRVNKEEQQQVDTQLKQKTEGMQDDKKQDMQHEKQRLKQSQQHDQKNQTHPSRPNKRSLSNTTESYLNLTGPHPINNTSSPPHVRRQGDSALNWIHVVKPNIGLVTDKKTGETHMLSVGRAVKANAEELKHEGVETARERGHEEKGESDDAVIRENDSEQVYNDDQNPVDSVKLRIQPRDDKKDDEKKKHDHKKDEHKKDDHKENDNKKDDHKDGHPPPGYREPTSKDLVDKLFEHSQLPWPEDIAGQAFSHRHDASPPKFVDVPKPDVQEGRPNAWGPRIRNSYRKFVAQVEAPSTCVPGMVDSNKSLWMGSPLWFGKKSEHNTEKLRNAKRWCW